MVMNQMIIYSLCRQGENQRTMYFSRWINLLIFTGYTVNIQYNTGYYIEKKQVKN